LNQEEEIQVAEDEIDPVKNIVVASISKIFAHFLITIGVKLNSQGYTEVLLYHVTVAIKMCLYVIFFARALNEIGFQHYEQNDFLQQPSIEWKLQ
jgi:hypothetical protein